MLKESVTQTAWFFQLVSTIIETSPFAVDPQMRVPEEDLYIRVEDTVVVTEDGVEILTGSAPWDLDEVEKLMKEEGILQKYPPVLAPRKKP